MASWLWLCRNIHVRRLLTLFEKFRTEVARFTVATPVRIRGISLHSSYNRGATS
jgi:hypothetical protein